jgi:hypothetical protein
VFYWGEALENDVHAFVIRVWNEGNGPGKTTVWRGYIEHVNHDSRLYFSDLNGITRFIQKQISIQSPGPVSGWRSWLSWITHAVAGVAKRLRF